jgi:hypothetical protein
MIVVRALVVARAVVVVMVNVAVSAMVVVRIMVAVDATVVELQHVWCLDFLDIVFLIEENTVTSYRTSVFIKVHEKKYGIVPLSNCRVYCRTCLQLVREQ